MEVKIYREVENENLILSEEDLQSYNDLLKELNIQTQDSISTHIVYPAINEELSRVISILCPQESKLENYTVSSIPLEVLKVIDYCKKQNMFDWYTVHYSIEKPDPILVGHRYTSDEYREKKYTWNTYKYIIGRWGDEAMELPELIKKGKEAIKAKIGAELRKAKANIERYLSNMDDIFENDDTYLIENIQIKNI